MPTYIYLSKSVGEAKLEINASTWRLQILVHFTDKKNNSKKLFLILEPFLLN